MVKRFSLLLVFSLVVLCSGRLAASDLFFENNLNDGQLRVRITNLNGVGEDILFESVGPGVYYALQDEPTNSPNRWDFFVYDAADVAEANLLVYAQVWNSEIVTAEQAGTILHVSISVGMQETSIGRIVLVNQTSLEATWNGYAVAGLSTNAFQIPDSLYTLARWDTVTRPWGWLSSVRFLQPIEWTLGNPLSDDHMMMLWLHNHDPEQWVTWSWTNEAGGHWVFGTIGDPNNGSGVGGGSGGGGTGGGGTGGGSGGGTGGGTGGGSGGAGGTGTVGTQTININLQGVALETTQLRNEQLLMGIQGHTMTNGMLIDQGLNHLAAIEALLTPVPPPVSQEAIIQSEAETNANAMVAGSEGSSTGIKGLFTQLINVTGAAANAPHSLFVIEFDIGPRHHEINYDPRDQAGLTVILNLFKSLVCLLVFYLCICHLWRWYDRKMGEMNSSTNTGTAGEAILGTNANLVTSAINASIIVAITGAIAILLVDLVVSSMTGSLLGNFMAGGTGLLDGTHSSWSSGAAQRAIVFVDMVLPINCIISGCFVVMLVEIVGHWFWLGGTAIIRYANA